MAGKIEELFSFSVEGVIWDTCLDIHSRQLLVQYRDVSAHETMFSLVDLSNGEALIHARRFNEPWWIGISAMVGDRAVLHIYEDDQRPERKSLWLWNTRTDRIILELEDSTLVSSSPAGFTIRQGDVLDHLDWDGKKIQSLPPTKTVDADTTKCHYPFQYQSEEAELDTIRTFIAQAVNVSIVADVEYLEYEGLVFISYYIEEAKMLDNYLLISDLDGTIHMNKKINANATGTGRDTFFIFEHKLIFISNRNRLYVYGL